MTLLPSFILRNLLPFPSICLNFTSHRALQNVASSVTYIQRKSAKTFLTVYLSPCSVFASTDGTYISSGLLHVCREMINLYFRLVARKWRVKIDLSCVAAGIAGRQDPNAGSRYKSYNK